MYGVHDKMMGRAVALMGVLQTHTHTDTHTHRGIVRTHTHWTIQTPPTHYKVDIYMYLSTTHNTLSINNVSKQARGFYNCFVLEVCSTNNG